MPGYIHHVEWCVRHLDSVSRQLVHQYGFVFTHERDFRCQRDPERTLIRQVVLRSGATVFVLTDNRCVENELQEVVRRTSGEYPVLTCCRSQKDHVRDSVFNVCFEVGNVGRLTETVQRYPINGLDMVLVPCGSATTGNGFRCSVVRSCCGNVIHSIVDRKYDRTDGFLPGFSKSKTASEPIEGCLTTSMDHVTYVCRPGESKKVLEWYSRCFGMRRFSVSRQDAVTDEGIVIGDEVRMRMMVGEWMSSWLCQEEGVQFESSEGDRRRGNLKLVLAEPLEGRSDSHVQHFLEGHGGPGLQHIGLAASEEIKVEKVVEAMTRNGASFRKPPPTYYKLREKVEEIRSAGANVADYERLGLLLDSEADCCDAKEDGSAPSQGKFLIQIFTTPLFKQDTFFLEVLERRGARGFGVHCLPTFPPLKRTMLRIHLLSSAVDAWFIKFQPNLLAARVHTVLALSYVSRSARKNFGRIAFRTG